MERLYDYLNFSEEKQIKKILGPDGRVFILNPFRENQIL
jgi:hypothetical protein